MEQQEEVELSVSAIATPLANQKLAKKVLKVVKKGAQGWRLTRRKLSLPFVSL